MKSLIIYFSRTGYNYVNGAIKDLKVGNTEIIANMIKEMTGADIFKIEPKVLYSNDYNECIEEAKEDQRKNLRPEIKSYPKRIEDYDVIFVGYPNYWGTMPMHMFTLFEKFDFSNKIICPFCTHEGSGMGSSERDLKKLCPKAKIKKGLAIQGATVSAAKDKVEAWLKSL